MQTVGGFWVDVEFCESEAGLDFMPLLVYHWKSA